MGPSVSSDVPFTSIGFARFFKWCFGSALAATRGHSSMTHVLSSPPATLARRFFRFAVQTIAELRYEALVSGWGELRQRHLESAIASTTNVPVTNTPIVRVAELRMVCRSNGHPRVDRMHAFDLWVAAAAIHVGVPLVTADHHFERVPGLQLLK